ncbi:hypothetical protein PFISCL1PPCAC_1064, partial [Pristionchus fissidentatus]
LRELKNDNRTMDGDSGQLGLGCNSAGFGGTLNLSAKHFLFVASTATPVGEKAGSRSALFISHRSSGAVSCTSSRCSHLHTAHSTRGRTGKVGDLSPVTPIGTDSDDKKNSYNFGIHHVKEKRRCD